MRSNVDRNDTCICDSEVARSIHDKAIIDHSPEVQWSHGCRTNGMEDWLQGLSQQRRDSERGKAHCHRSLDVRYNLVVSHDRRSGYKLRRYRALQWFGIGNSLGELETLDQNLHI